MEDHPYYDKELRIFRSMDARKYYSNKQVIMERTHSACAFPFKDDGIDKDVKCNHCDILQEIRYTPDAIDQNTHDHEWSKGWDFYNGNGRQHRCSCGKIKWTDPEGNEVDSNVVLNGWRESIKDRPRDAKD